MDGEFRPGQYIPIYWPDDPEFEAVAGHVTDEEAREAVFMQCGWPAPGDVYQVERRWAHWRGFMFLDAETRYADEIFEFCGEFDSGAMPVTIVRQSNGKADKADAQI